MNWLLIVSHGIAKQLSYYRAGWDFPASAERDRRKEYACQDAWRLCRAALEEAGIYDEFRKAGRYLI
jgi:hypothetical protein